MKRTIIIHIFLLFIFSFYGCAKRLGGGVFLQKTSDRYGKYYLLVSNQIPLVKLQSMRNMPISDPYFMHPYHYLVLDARKRVMKNEDIDYQLEVFYKDKYSDDNFLKIPSGSTLILAIDGENYTFSGPGSYNYRHMINLAQTPARVHGKVLVEKAYYDVTPDQIRKIAFANEIKVEIHGSQIKAYAEFHPKAIANFRSFYNEYVTNSSASESHIDTKGWTELMIAVHSGNKDSVVALIKKGIDLDQTNEEGITALMIAAKYDRITPATLLIENGANVNAKSNLGKTVLMLAAEYGNTEMARTLIRNGANLNDKDNKGKTALMLAENNGHKYLATMLRYRGAKK